MPVTDKR
jgi:hypothetical protein